MIAAETDFELDAMSRVTIYLATGSGVQVEMDDPTFEEAVAALGRGQVSLFRDMKTGEEFYLPPHAITFLNRQSPRMVEAKRAAAKLLGK